jgi:hypothetical protein
MPLALQNDAAVQAVQRPAPLRRGAIGLGGGLRSSQRGCQVASGRQ